MQNLISMFVVGEKHTTKGGRLKDIKKQHHLENVQIMNDFKDGLYYDLFSSVDSGTIFFTNNPQH